MLSRPKAYNVSVGLTNWLQLKQAAHTITIRTVAYFSIVALLYINFINNRNKDVYVCSTYLKT